MPVSARHCALAVSLVLSAAVANAGDQGIYLPTAPHGSGGEDSIETASGTRCRQSINSNGAYLDVGVAATRSTGANASPYRIDPGASDEGTQALGYARMVVPIGQKPKRIDCSRLYELELARMQREIELLRIAAE